MLAAFVTVLVVTQAAPKLPAAPPAVETARLYFLAGDVAKAQEWARRGAKKEPTCKAMLKLLAEYAFLANHVDELTPEQAQSFLSLDAKIAPDGVGKLTEKVIERHITKPLAVARLRAEAGDRTGATEIAKSILVVDPKHAETLAFLAMLSRSDAGVAAP